MRWLVTIRQGQADEQVLGHGMLSDESPRASYGHPVLVWAGTAYGPRDEKVKMVSLVLAHDPTLQEAIDAHNLARVIALGREREGAERWARRAGWCLARRESMREYIIYDSRRAMRYGGGHKFNAYPTHGQPWAVLRDCLPPDVCNYARIQAANKPAAVAEARRRWA